MKQHLLLLIIAIFIPVIVLAGERLEWRELPSLLPLPDGSEQLGVAGAFAGVHNDAFILAGGANFPDGVPWNRTEDGLIPKKIYHTDVYLLQKGTPWIISDLKLPRGYSYGVSISTSEGLVCIGGEWQEQNEVGTKKHISSKVFCLKHIGNGKLSIDTTRFPDLPSPVTNMAGTRIGNYIYVLGGNDGGKETKNFWRLDITQKDKWEQLNPWPGPPRSHLIAVAQNDGTKECLYIFSGRYRDPIKGWQFLADSYKYDPVADRWTQLADVGTSLSSKESVCVMAAPAIQIGANQIAIFGGASGDIFRQVEQDIPQSIRMLRHNGQEEEAAELEKKRWLSYKNHPGFSRTIQIYNTITDSWIKFGKIPESIINGRRAGSQLTTTAVRWGDEIIIPSGEVFPGVRSPKVLAARVKADTAFGIINYIVLGSYLLLLLAMGYYFSKREHNTDDFFKAGGRIPWWAAGLSIFGTQLSAITFMAIPAKSFATDWTWFIFNMTIILVAPFIVYVFLPFYRRLNVTTAYEYIEKRFNVWIRLMASSMFILFQFARIGIVLYLPSIALSIVTGLDIDLCILTMGVLAVAYTVMGGIEAVIWTDVFQVIILLGGAILVLLLIPAHVSDGFSGMVQLSLDAEKLRLFDFHFNLKSATFWVLVLGGIGANIISYGSDQTVIQRYLTTKDEKDAARSIWANGLLSIPASLLFFGLGTALFTFYKSNPDSLNIVLDNTDAILPWFIVSQLPVGISGLLIAGIFAAAMSSLDSSMNSVATAFTIDFYKRFKPGATETRYLNVARISTFLVGISGIALALAMATWDIQSLWSEFAKYIGLFGGGLGGLFILAIFTRRANAAGALTGLILSTMIQYVLNLTGLVHGVLLAATGLISCFILGYLASLIVPQKKKNLTGLTLFSLPENENIT